MATFTAVQAGNWNDYATWGDPGGGQGSVEGTDFPGPANDVALATYVVTANIARLPSTGSLGTITASGIGQLTFPLNVGNFSLYATTIGAGTCTTGIINTSGAGGGNALTIHCTSVTGGSATNAFGIYHGSAAGIVNAYCDIIGGTGANAHGFNGAAAGVIANFYGNSSGAGLGNGVHSASAVVFNFIGTASVPLLITGGATSATYGLYVTHASSATSLTYTNMVWVFGAPWAGVNLTWNLDQNTYIQIGTVIFHAKYLLGIM